MSIYDENAITNAPTAEIILFLLVIIKHNSYAANIETIILKLKNDK